MKAVEKWKAWVFVGSLALLAAVLNAGYDYLARETELRQHALLAGEEQRQKAAQTQQAAEQERIAEKQKDETERKEAEARWAQAQRKAAEEALAEHARYLARYLNTNDVARTPGTQTAAIVVASENHAINHAVVAALTNRFKTEPFQLCTSLFRPEFVSDGLCDNVFGGSTHIMTRLELTNLLDVLVLARQRVEYVTNVSLQNVLTANMRLEVTTFSVAAGIQGQTWTFTATGAGFQPLDARALAEERLIKQLTSDTNMSLTQ